MKELNSNGDGKYLVFNGLGFRVLCIVDSLKKNQRGWRFQSQNFNIFPNADESSMRTFPMGR